MKNLVLRKKISDQLLSTTFRKYSVNYVQNTNGRNEFRCSGTPVDCVKLELNTLLPQQPDVGVSGINHGYNHSLCETKILI